MFDIPVVLIIFRRCDTMPRIIQRLAEVKPRKVYILADEGRNEKEIEQAHECRKTVEALINWDCEVVKTTLKKTVVFTAILVKAQSGCSRERKKLSFWKMTIFRKLLSLGTPARCWKNMKQHRKFSGYVEPTT